MKPGHLRIGSLEGYRSFVLELGGDPRAFLRDANIDEALWDNPDAPIAARAYHAALNIAAKRLEIPRFGLLLSQRQSFEKMGAVGYALKNAPDLRTGVREFAKFFHKHDRATRIELEPLNDGAALWRITCVDGREESVVQRVELSLGLAVKAVRHEFGPAWSPQALHFEHAKPTERRDHDRIFRCPVYFDQPLNAIEVSAEDMDRPLASAEQKLFRILRSYLSSQADEEATTIAGKCRASITKLMADGDPTLHATADSLGYSPLQLQRRLKAEGVTYRSILDLVRQDVAQHYLRDTDLPLTTIADIVGYSELAAFSRAFRRLTGQSPKDWRRNIA